MTLICLWIFLNYVICIRFFFRYFDSTIELCRAWINNCNKGCSYQLDFFKCQDNEFFDLESMRYVSACADNQLEMTGEQLYNLSFCRGYDYYVKPQSGEILELETKQFPYKNLMLPFIEIYNFHSNNPSVDINIYVYERSSVEIAFRKINIVNIYKVNLLSYTEIDEEPAKIEFFVRDTDIDYWMLKQGLTS